MNISAKENLLRAIRHDSPHWVPNGIESQIMIGPPVVERPRIAERDAFAVDWSYEEGAEGGTYPTHGGHSITDLSKWREHITIPNVDDLDWSAAKTKAEAIDRGNHVVAGFVEMGLFERSYLLLGMEEALMAYLTEPELMTDLINAIADYKVELINRFDDEVNLDILWYGDDWGTQDNLFIPPSIWRTVIKPATQRIYDCLKARNIIINQHSCGKIETIFADMVDMGADLWNPCQPCNDLAGLKKQFSGKIAFCGGIDSQFVLDRDGVTPEEVRAEVRTRIDEMGAGGGYIAAASHSVPYDDVLLNAMNDEITTYGREIYQR